MMRQPNPGDELRESFARAVAALPEPLRKQVSEFTSGRSPDGTWGLNDANGQPVQPPQVKAAPVQFATANGVTRIAKLLIGAHAELMARVETLEAQRKDLRDTTEHDARLRFRGIWQPTDVYERGSLVRHKQALYFCNRTSESVPGADDAWTIVLRGAQRGFSP